MNFCTKCGCALDEDSDEQSYSGKCGLCRQKCTEEAYSKLGETDESRLRCELERLLDQSD